jgi:hypothetical protein
MQLSAILSVGRLSGQRLPFCQGRRGRWVRREVYLNSRVSLLKLHFLLIKTSDIQLQLQAPRLVRAARSSRGRR